MEVIVIRVAINGFGRIGRLALRYAFSRKDIQIVAINDLCPIENLAYLLKYDSVHKTFDRDIKISNNKLIIDNQEILITEEKDPLKIAEKLNQDKL